MFNYSGASSVERVSACMQMVRWIIDGGYTGKRDQQNDMHLRVRAADWNIKHMPK